MDEAELRVHKLLCPTCELEDDDSLPCKKMAMDSFNRCVAARKLPTKCLLVALFGIIDAVAEQASPEVAKYLALTSLHRFASMTAAFLVDETREETKKEFDDILNELRNFPKGDLHG